MARARIGVCAEGLGDGLHFRRLAVQARQRFQANDGAFELPAAAADMIGQPFQNARLDLHASAGDAILQKEQPAGGRQRFHADDQPARQPAGEAGGQAFQQGRPHGRGEDQLNLPGEAAVQKLHNRLDGPGRQAMHILDGDQIGLAGGGEVGGGFAWSRSKSPAVRMTTDRPGRRSTTRAARPATRCDLTDAGGAVQRRAG